MPALLALSACTAADAPEERVDSHAVAVEEEPAACTIEDEPALVTLALPIGIGDADLDLETNGALRITIHNASDEAGSASARIRSRSEAGWNATTVDAGRVAAGGSRDVDLAAAILALPSRSFDHSGSVTIAADLELDSGEIEHSPVVQVFFHPTDSGWLLYDRAGRASRHDDGALTESARVERAAFVERFGAGGTAAGRSPGRKISDSASFVPENDVPVDQDQ